MALLNQLKNLVTGEAYNLAHIGEKPISPLAQNQPKQPLKPRLQKVLGASTSSGISPKDQWVTNAMNVFPDKSAKELRSMYEYATHAPGGILSEFGPQKHAQASTVTPTAEPTPTPFGKQVLDGYISGTPDELKPYFDKAAKTHGVPTSYLTSVAKHESMGFNPDVISGKLNSPVGAQGLMQFMPSTSQGMGVDPLDPQSAIMGGARLLKGHYEQFNNRPDLALAAYNAGAGNVHKYGGIPPFPETQNYVKNIMNDASATTTNRRGE